MKAIRRTIAFWTVLGLTAMAQHPQHASAGMDPTRFEQRDGALAARTWIVGHLC